MLREDHPFSYLSNRPRTVFFRELAFVYPELLDTMCLANDHSIHQVQHALRFICSCIEASNNRPSDHQPLFTAVHEWLVGPVIQLLAFEDDDDSRKALSKLLTMLRPKFGASRERSASALAVAAFRHSITGSSECLESAPIEAEGSSFPATIQTQHGRSQKPVGPLHTSAAAVTAGGCGHL
jgi:hypothetical protein